MGGIFFLFCFVFHLDSRLIVKVWARGSNGCNTGLARIPCFSNSASPSEYIDRFFSSRAHCTFASNHASKRKVKVEIIKVSLI